MNTWYYVRNGVPQGPVTEEALRALIASGAVPPATPVWREGMDAWQDADAIPGLVPPAAVAGPPPLPPPAPSALLPAPAVPQTSGKAVGALVSSILGLTTCLFVGQIIGLVLGYSARREIRASNGRLTGDGLATAGIVIGWIGLAIDLFVVVLLVAWMVAAGAVLAPMAAGF